MTDVSRTCRRGICIAALGVLLLAGCATVRPEQKEHLAEHGMRFDASGMSASHEQHVLDNREGSTGGGTTRGGGCGCN